MTDFQSKIDGFILKNIAPGSAFYGARQPLSLLTWNRLDLAFKLFYLRNKARAHDISTTVYKYDITAQTLGSFKEKGNPQKSSFENYVKDFDKISLSISENGMTSDVSIVPVASDGSVINGAHRTASCIYHNKEIAILKTELKPLVCNYEYFQKLGVPSDIIEIVVREFLRYSKNSYAAFLWPSGKKNYEVALAEFPNVVYETEVQLSSFGAFNLIHELYRHMPWVGTKENGFSGVKRKFGECFPSLQPVKVVIFQAKNISEVQELKHRIRELNNVGLSSIHITDTPQETQDAADLILCGNGRHFLNFGNPNKFQWQDKLNQFGSNVSEEHLKNASVIDGSFVLELYGLREARDIDYVIDDEVLKIELQNQNDHDSDLQYHDVPKQELIYDPRNSFTYMGQRFVNIFQIQKMKRRRGEFKDMADVQLIKSLEGDSTVSKAALLMKQRVFHLLYKTKMNFHRHIRGILVRIGLLEQAKALVNIFRGKTR